MFGVENQGKEFLFTLGREGVHGGDGFHIREDVRNFLCTRSLSFLTNTVVTLSIKNFVNSIDFFFINIKKGSLFLHSNYI